MSISILTDEANEQSTYIITAAFTDENGAAVTPDSIAWTLTDTAGTEIATGTVATPAASVDIVLSGTQLAVQDGESGDVKRIFTVEAVFDSDAGDDLPLKDSCKFLIRNLVAVS